MITVSSFFNKRSWRWVWRLALMLVGTALMAGALYQKWGYSDLLRAGNEAVGWRQFDSLAYEKASGYFLADPDVVAYNIGVRAYEAKSYKKAAESFRDVVNSTSSPELKRRSYYNLGNLLTLMSQPREAVAMYEEALRLNPGDWDAKHNLERLFVFHAAELGEEKNSVPLKQAPGSRQPGNGNPGQGSGTGTPDPGI